MAGDYSIRKQHFLCGPSWENTIDWFTPHYMIAVKQHWWAPQALEDKRESLEPLMSEIDALDSQMGALEAMLERLDAATTRLDGRIADARRPDAAA